MKLSLMRICRWRTNGYREFINLLRLLHKILYTHKMVFNNILNILFFVSGARKPAMMTPIAFHPVQTTALLLPPPTPQRPLNTVVRKDFLRRHRHHRKILSTTTATVTNATHRLNVDHSDRRSYQQTMPVIYIPTTIRKVHQETGSNYNNTNAAGV